MKHGVPSKIITTYLKELYNTIDVCIIYKKSKILRLFDGILNY